MTRIITSNLSADCIGLYHGFVCKRGGMRFVVCLPLWLGLGLLAPSSAWCGAADLTAGLAPRAVIGSVTRRPGALVDPAALCETAVAAAEYVNRLPPRLLGAISLTETGRADPETGQVRAWPWTINAEGEGQFFASRDQAIAAVRALQARGVQSIDVGCMQVNLMYHPDAFASLEAAFDPHSNANHAARFLNALYANGKNWARAIAAYHSETPALGDAYRVLVEARWQRGGAPDAGGPTGSGGSGAYQDFGHPVAGGNAYGAFAPSSRVYGAFPPR